MTACLVWCVLSVSAAPAPEPEPPREVKPVVLLAGSDEYKNAKATEAVYEGDVENNPGDGGVGKPTRFNAYRLKGKDKDGKEFVRELYVPGKAFLLASYVGKRVRVTGKFIDTGADGKTYAELWPAQLEEVIVAAAPPPAADGVLARCVWQPSDALRSGSKFYVFRNGRELAQKLRVTGGSVEEAASNLLAQKLDVFSINWDKQMVVCVSAGLRGAEVDRLTVTRVLVKDKTLTVYYKLPPPAAGGSGFGYPAETVLVDRFDGTVRVEEEPAAPKEPASK
jgi:hypothetical protein